MHVLQTEECPFVGVFVRNDLTIEGENFDERPRRSGGGVEV